MKPESGCSSPMVSKWWVTPLYFRFGARVQVERAHARRCSRMTAKMSCGCREEVEVHQLRNLSPLAVGERDGALAGRHAPQAVFISLIDA
jgi:hypothetical protein